MLAGRCASPENDGAAYKRFIHRLFVALFVDLAEVDAIGMTLEALRVDGHKRRHERGGVHGSQIITLHVFA